MSRVVSEQDPPQQSDTTNQNIAINTVSASAACGRASQVSSPTQHLSRRTNCARIGVR